MRKIFFIIIAAVLLLGVAGCESLRDAHNNAASLTPEADEDAGAAWKWIEISNGKADLTPEAQELWDKGI